MPIRDDLQREKNRAWYGDPNRKAHCHHCGASVLDLAHGFFEIGFDVGGGWAIRRTTELNPHVSEFVDLLIALALSDELLVSRLVSMLRLKVLGEIDTAESGSNNVHHATKDDPCTVPGCVHCPPLTQSPVGRILP